MGVEYADVVATMAALGTLGLYAWQVKLLYWNRPNIAFEGERVMTQEEHGPGRVNHLGWVAEVTVTNTGDADTTLLALEWEFDAVPDSDDPSIFVAGNTGLDGLTIDVQETAPGVTKTTFQPDEGNEFEPIVMGRNHVKLYQYRIYPFALEGKLANSTRARPVAKFVHRSRRKHGIQVTRGNWNLVPRPDRDGPFPPGIVPQPHY
ncbi:hypothetical protein AU184_07280 [Mycolicibacterium novocastrense]|uniref:hypothetical protein n=1 Tax=Mycolicibacterium novocastrense TaxID=59813 RepID=UPI000746908D|nr:hypothetical protein [Mycolicibacterium novocastrense]KUH73662.1 hypothetical protein AU183_25200 [Mycolicibacterium novocastrense]KUH74754.1 hypothetical protein AU072_12270 [Mycolicibacterium novocastrense]KUH76069.1 hypothetical protein AU184_07280 [Mycolicibacterium novocastrense]